jgi:hypothetical protein
MTTRDAFVLGRERFAMLKLIAATEEMYIDFNPFLFHNDADSELRHSTHLY